MLEALLYCGLAPREVFSQGFLFNASELLRKVEQPFGGIGVAIEQDVLDVLEKLRFDFIVDLQHACVDNAHVHAGPGGVIEEG